MDEACDGTARQQLGLPPGGVCEEHTRLLRAVDEAFIAREETVRTLLKITRIGNQARFVEAQKAADRALVQLRSQCGALSEHIQQHDC